MKKILMSFLIFSSSAIAVKLPMMDDTYRIVQTLANEEAQGNKASACALKELYALANRPGEYRFENRICEEKLIALGVIDRSNSAVLIQHAANMAMLSYSFQSKKEL